MTYAVAFDASRLAMAALARARDLGQATGHSVVAVTCVPDSPARAREKGWIGPEESYDLKRAVNSVREAVHGVAPEAATHCETVDGRVPTGVVRGAIRDAVAAVDPDVVFVGSERAGGAATPMGSIAGTLVTAGDYDVYLVREESSDYSS